MKNKVKELLKNKKMLLIIGAVIIVVIVIVLLITLLNKNGLIGGISNPDGEKFKSEYEELNNQLTEDGKEYPEVKLPANNLIKYTNTKEVLDIFEKDEDAVIYFGYPTCLYCRSAIEVLCDVAKDTELDAIYYLDIEEKDENYSKLVEVLGEELILETDGNKEIYAPLVIFVSYGNVVSYNKGTLFSQEDPYTELDYYQIEGLGEIYSYGIRDVVESKKNRAGIQ